MANLTKSKRCGLWFLFAVLLSGLLFGVTLLLSSGQAARANAGIIYVDAAATGAATGVSWTDAFTSVQDALTGANYGHEIWVAEGVYTPDEGLGQTDGDRGSTFTLQPGVALYGGFAGTENLRGQRDWTTNVTVLSGDIDGDDGTDAHGVVIDTANIAGANAYHVVTGGGVGNTAVLDGFTITAGSADGTESPHDTGGGMLNEDSSPTLANVTFSGNQADEDGGGMHNYDNSSPTLTNVTFSTNQADEDGGGMSNLFSAPALNHVIFAGNQAEAGGAGMFNDNSSPTITCVTFRGNQAGSGGGLYNWISSPTLTHVTFSANHADEDGGAMSNTTSNPMLTDVAFSGNDAGYGGGMYNYTSSPTLTNVTFSGNHALYGAGIYNYDDSGPQLINVALTGNGAERRGGGMSNDKGSSPTLINVTFGGNHAAWNGGGMHNYDNSNPALTNAILWGNSPDQISNDSSTPAVHYSDVQGGCDAIPSNACGLGNISDDPRFVAAVSASEAPTSTGDYHLRRGSPAADAGLNAALPGTVTTDLDGNPRIVDGNGDGDAAVDMGAFELPPVFTTYLPFVVRNHTACQDILVNGDFESSEGWLLSNAAYDTETVQQGLRSLRTGVLPGEWPDRMQSREQAGQSIGPLFTAPLGDLEGPSVDLQAGNFSSARQEITLPEGSDIHLTYWSYAICEGGDAGDLQYVILQDQTGVDYWLRADRRDTRTWERYEHDLSLYAGQTVTLYFGSYNDGDGDTTALFVDDAAVWVCDDGG